jgi:hypothetical protein
MTFYPLRIDVVELLVSECRVVFHCAVCHWLLRRMHHEEKGPSTTRRRQKRPQNNGNMHYWLMATSRKHRASNGAPPASVQKIAQGPSIIERLAPCIWLAFLHHVKGSGGNSATLATS